MDITVPAFNFWSIGGAKLIGVAIAMVTCPSSNRIEAVIVPWVMSYQCILRSLILAVMLQHQNEPEASYLSEKGLGRFLMGSS